MKYIFLFLLSFVLNLLISSSTSYAIYDPVSHPNNRVGVHILETTEISDAAKLINSHGGDWGYVTIPIRSDDRDKTKWLAFFKDCIRLHVIPIIRLATYLNRDSWVAPNAYDLVDYANFLSEMPWPTQNRYVIIFNEPNQGKEWGGVVDPNQYATMLIQANRIFKPRSANFFLISAGLDMSVPNSSSSQDALYFYRLMTIAHPDWYSSVDGLGIHAYPNPGFSAPITSQTRYGPKSYLYEISTLRSQGFSPKPLFITETGNITGNDIYTTGFNEIWTEPQIVTITPFLLFAGAGDFTRFSLLDQTRQPKDSYLGLLNLSKKAGSPLLNPDIDFLSLANSITDMPSPSSAPNFITRIGKILFPPPPHVTINSSSGTANLVVDIADNPTSQALGLSYRPNLPAGQGMLFVFSSSQIQTFWMKDMNFPLDFIWINKGKVVSLNENIPPPSQTNNQPQILDSKLPCDQVLEVNAGYIAAHKINIGDSVTLTKN